MKSVTQPPAPQASGNIRKNTLVSASAPAPTGPAALPQTLAQGDSRAAGLAFIGGSVACCEPGCMAVLGSLADWDVHMREIHPDQMCARGCREPRVTASGLCAYCEDQLCAC